MLFLYLQSLLVNGSNVTRSDNFGCESNELNVINNASLINNLSPTHHKLIVVSETFQTNFFNTENCYSLNAHYGVCLCYFNLLKTCLFLITNCLRASLRDNF